MADVPDAPIAPDVLRLMRQVVETAATTRPATLAEAAAEARGRHPDMPAATVDAAVDGILGELCAHGPPTECRGAESAGLMRPVRGCA